MNWNYVKTPRGMFKKDQVRVTNKSILVDGNEFLRSECTFLQDLD